MKISFLFISLLLFSFGYLQNSHNNIYQKEDKIYQLMELDSMPTFKGGYDSLVSYIDNHFIFPKIHAESSVQGKVICMFIVTETGNITNVKILQGLDEYINNEVVRVMYSMPQWNPGKRNGQNVKSEYFLSTFIRMRIE